MTLSGPKRRLLRLLACVPAAAAAMANPAAAQDGCTLTAIGTAAVVAIRDGRTLLLEDGREVRLAGIEVTAGSRDMVRRLASGRTLQLAGLGAETDRYGRLVAFVFPAGARESLQHSLLAAGQARVSARIGDKACADSLLATERAARAAGRGHWALGADPNFAPLSSENLTGLAAARGHFALVEGKVLSVRESGGTIYVNFGRRWTRDFTVTILKRRRGSFAAAGIEPKSLTGRRIRVRGWIERRGGPIIEATAPEQIEPID